MHGGTQPIRTGQHRRYQITPIRVRELLEAHGADEKPLDLLPELALARALLQEFIERTAEDDHGEQLPEAIRLVDKVAGIVKAIEEIKSKNALTLADLSRLMLNMGLVVRKHVTDPAVCEKIQSDWDALRL